MAKTGVSENLQPLKHLCGSLQIPEVIDHYLTQNFNSEK